jgi:hypothetical protein
VLILLEPPKVDGYKRAEVAEHSAEFLCGGMPERHGRRPFHDNLRAEPAFQFGTIHWTNLKR